VAGRFFAQRLASAICAASTVTVAEWFFAYRLIVPRTTNGRAGPRPLEEAWRARLLKAKGAKRSDVAAALGFVTPRELERARAERSRDLPGDVHAKLLESAEKRVTRNERRLHTCEQRIIDDGRTPPAWLQSPRETGSRASP
jgi:hypothetical protein